MNMTNTTFIKTTVYEKQYVSHPLVPFFCMIDTMYIHHEMLRSWQSVAEFLATASCSWLSIACFSLMHCFSWPSKLSINFSLLESISTSFFMFQFAAQHIPKLCASLLSGFWAVIAMCLRSSAHCFTNCALDKSQWSAVTCRWHPHIFNASFLSPCTSLMVVSCLTLLQIRFCVAPHEHPQQVEHGRTSAKICCTCSGWSAAIVLSCGGCGRRKVGSYAHPGASTQSQSRPH